MNKIYLVYAQDMYNMTSVSLVLMTTSLEKLESFVAKMIKEEDFYYGGLEIPSARKAVSLFKKDFEKNNGDMSVINNSLQLGFIDSFNDGEEINIPYTLNCTKKVIERSFGE